MIQPNNKLKLIDFGFSVIQGKKLLSMFCGTPSYMSPELVKKQDYDGFSSDIWACGVCLFVMVNGTFPFKGNQDRFLFQQIMKGDI